MKDKKESKPEVPEHGIKVETLLSKSHVINMPGGYITMTAIQEQTGLEKDDLVPALRWLLSEGRLETIQGNGFGAHRYRIRPAAKEKTEEAVVKNKTEIERRLPKVKQKEKSETSAPVKEKNENKEIKKSKVKMQRKSGRFEKLIPEMAHKIQNVEFTEDVAVIELERRPGSKRVTIGISDAISLGDAAKEKKSQGKKPKQEKTA